MNPRPGSTSASGSSNLEGLVVSGQTALLSPPPAGGAKTVTHSSPEHSVTTALRASGPGLGGAVINAAAIDTAPGAGIPFISDTFNMRNQAHTEQVEVHGTTNSFTFDLELMAEAFDADNDGLPDDWESLYNLSTTDDGAIDINNGPDGDPDVDGILNHTEWLVGLNPINPDTRHFPQLKAPRMPDGSVRLQFPTIPDRRCRIWWGDSLDGWPPAPRYRHLRRSRESRLCARRPGSGRQPTAPVLAPRNRALFGELSDPCLTSYETDHHLLLRHPLMACEFRPGRTRPRLA